MGVARSVARRVRVGPKTAKKDVAAKIVVKNPLNLSSNEVISCDWHGLEWSSWAHGWRRVSQFGTVSARSGATCPQHSNATKPARRWHVAATSRDYDRKKCTKASTREPRDMTFSPN